MLAIHLQSDPLATMLYKVVIISLYHISCYFGVWRQEDYCNHCLHGGLKVCVSSSPETRGGERTGSSELPYDGYTYAE